MSASLPGDEWLEQGAEGTGREDGGAAVERLAVEGPPRRPSGLPEPPEHDGAGRGH